MQQLCTREPRALASVFVEVFAAAGVAYLHPWDAFGQG